MNIQVFQEDLPDHITFREFVAIDTETMGLNHLRDRLCVVQLGDGQGNCYLVRFANHSTYTAPNLRKILTDPSLTKIFHFARFDLAALYGALKIETTPIFCTKIASKLCRTYTDRHGLKELCREIIGVDLSKQEQSSDWGADVLSEEQIQYAARDVLHLHSLKDKLMTMLIRENRLSLAQACFNFLPYRAHLDLMGWGETDIFQH